MEIGSKIKNLRLQNGLTQEELGQRMGIKKSAVCRLESEFGSFTIERIIRAARAIRTNSCIIELISFFTSFLVSILYIYHYPLNLFLLQMPDR